MSKTHLRLVSLVTLICFMTTGIAWGAPGAGMLAGSTGRETPTFLQIDIPQDLASIEEIYEAPAKADPTLVLHIQNLHGNYEAQSQIKKLLDYLYKTYAFKLIFVEGAAEKLNADYLRLFADDEQNRDLADYLTHKGQLTGPEFYLMDGPKDVEAIGIEQSDLYRKNLESFRAVYGAKEMIDKKLSGYDAKIDALASSVFTQGARKMISEWRKFESGHRDFLPYVKRLSQEAKKVLGLDLESLFAQVEWPQVTRLLVIQSMEAELNRKAAEDERARLAGFLNKIQVDPEIITAVKKLGERRISMSRLDANGKENRLENLPRYLLERLVAEAGPKGFYFHDYPAFSLYAGYLILQSELQSQALYEEINLLFEKILAEQTPSEKEKNLLELFRDMELLKKLMHLELTRKEWKRAAYRKEWINPRSIEKRLQDITLAAFSTSPDTKANGGESIDAFFDTALEFYDFARAREGAFYETIKREMGKSKSEKAVLVTGGFHTEGLMDLFREHEVNYGVLLPRILGSVADPENKYSEAMMESGSTLFDLATIEINSLLQSPETYRNLGGNNWKAVQSVLDAFLNKGIYASAEEAFNALNFASQGIFAKDQGFQFVPLPSKQVLFRITGDALINKVRKENHFDVDAEGYLQSRDGKYLIFEVRPVRGKQSDSMNYIVTIRFQDQNEQVVKPASQNTYSPDKILPPQTLPPGNPAPVPGNDSTAPNLPLSVPPGSAPFATPVSSSVADSRSEARSIEVDRNDRLELIRQQVLTLFKTGLDNMESSFGIHGTSLEAIEVLLKTGRLPAEGRHPNEFYFYPKGGKEYDVESASLYAEWNAKKYYLAKKLPFPLDVDLYEELAAFVTAPFVDKEGTPNLLKKMAQHEITEKVMRGWLREVEKQNRKGVVITVSSEIQKHAIFTPAESADERYIRIPGGLPLNMITGIEPIGEYEYDYLNSLDGNGRSEVRRDARDRVVIPVQKGDEKLRLGVRGDIPGEADPKVKVGLNSGGFASTLETFEGIVKVLRNRASIVAASPFDEVVKDLGSQSGIPGIENFLDEPGLVGILNSDVPSDEDLRALAGLLLIFPRLSFHIIVRSESASLAPEQTELIRSIKAAKGRDGEAVGKRLIVSVAKRPQAVKQILDRWASRQANETANKLSSGKEKISAADIQSNLVALGIESMFEDLNLVSAKQVHGVEDEKRLARFDIQSLVSAMLSRNSAALLKEMPEVIQLEDPGQNVFTIIRSGINSISENLTEAFEKAYKIATSA